MRYLPGERRYEIGFCVAVVAFLLLASCQRGHAHDWQGFAMNHRERTAWGYEPRGSAQIITVPYEDEQAAYEKALRDQKTCGPVVLWLDEGRVSHPSQGCRK